MKLSNEIKEKLKQEIKTNATYFSYAGDVSLFQAHQTLFQETYGCSDMEKEQAFTSETPLSVSLLNRLFASVAILLLEQQKKLKTSDLISYHIPDYSQGHLIKIIHLLQYTSQIPDYTSTHLMLDLTQTEAYQALTAPDQKRIHIKETTKRYAFEEILSWINAKPLLHKPGGTFEFNTDSTLIFLKEIIERASKMTYDAYILKHIIEPAKVVYQITTQSKTKHYDQTDEVFHFEIQMNPDPHTLITLSATEAKKLMLAFVNQEIIDSSIWSSMKRFKDDVGIGLFKEAGALELSFGCLSHQVICRYVEDLGLAVIFTTNYQGDWKMEHGKWHSFVDETMKAVATTYVYPKNPVVEIFSKKNRYDFFDIEITTEQVKYVPDVYKCLAYTYQDRHSKSYVLKDHGQSVGMFTLTVNKKYEEYHIRFFLIDKRFQNRGYGKRMLKMAVLKLRDQGARILEIGLVSENIPALRMYQAVGFKPFDMSANFITLRMVLED
ncbi:MAG: GNAT family N-acetyltransferase [Acholeplasmataceae bacterium]|nr:GNAT family N-acetyltransferase [Acholeplasmataceae bacterium]